MQRTANLTGQTTGQTGRVKDSGLDPGQTVTRSLSSSGKHPASDGSSAGQGSKGHHRLSPLGEPGLTRDLPNLSTNNAVSHCQPFWLRSRRGWFHVLWRDNGSRKVRERTLHTHERSVALERANVLLAAGEQERVTLLTSWLPAGKPGPYPW